MGYVRTITSFESRILNLVQMNLSLDTFIPDWNIVEKSLWRLYLLRNFLCVILLLSDTFYGSGPTKGIRYVHIGTGKSRFLLSGLGNLVDETKKSMEWDYVFQDAPTEFHQGSPPPHQGRHTTVQVGFGLWGNRRTDKRRWRRRLTQKLTHEVANSERL